MNAPQTLGNEVNNYLKNSNSQTKLHNPKTKSYGQQIQ